ncbi:MAG TPA: replication factor C large subunit [Candidatus Caldiarchaeum subterraneum]|uniref:Replication factor C large subunit n=1 Tax=Caldiarchaeum subterraneum TaxID=311458 RepID=A0A832ZX29_CALS0|nr:replication factor C large subunit [Candidatus Caldarchaeum subterraneum]
MQNIPWTEKYRPKRVSEVAGNKEAVENFLKWLRSWEAGKPGKKAALLHGPAGVGKTSLVLAYANENNMDVVEVNASDFRTAERIKQIVGMSSQQRTILGKKRIILVDEVDGIAAREDVGGLPALSRIIDETKVPIVMVANDPWDQRLATLREKSILIEFKRLPRTTVQAQLKRICEAEKIECPDDALKSIAERSSGDLRSAINDLQALAAAGKISREALNALGYRTRDKEIFAALAMAFNAKTVREGRLALEGLDLDPPSFFQWIFDNAPEQIPDVRVLSDALEKLARADIHIQRVNNLQRWSLMKYAIPLMTTGVAVEKRKLQPRFVKFSFPSKIRFMTKTRAEREVREGIAGKIAKLCHLSTRKAMRHMLPYLKCIVQKNPEEGRRLAKALGLSSEELSYLQRAGS